MQYPHPWKKIAIGGFGTIWKAQNAVSGEEVVIKKQPVSRISWHPIFYSVVPWVQNGKISQREVAVLSMLRQSNRGGFVEMLNSFEEGGYSHIVMVYYPLGTLRDHLTEYGCLGREQGE